jgi:hypothetical protein
MDEERVLIMPPLNVPMVTCVRGAPAGEADLCRPTIPQL